MQAEHLRIASSDGVVLQGEFVAPAAPRATVVLCHPHPQYGGTMRSIVVSALFEALPAAGYACLRFNFRGVEDSTGTYSEGKLEVDDARAAVDTAAADRYARPLVLAGWSFGADMALSVDDGRVDGWLGIAAPLRFRDNFDTVAHDARPKHLVLAQHDEFRSPAEVQADVAAWTATTTEVVPGASHFFIGRTDRVVAATVQFVASLG
jgi:alpha/beta superfamily hydrolase